MPTRNRPDKSLIHPGWALIVSVGWHDEPDVQPAAKEAGFHPEAQ
jgi:hypothetical protein